MSLGYIIVVLLLVAALVGRALYKVNGALGFAAFLAIFVGGLLMSVTTASALAS